MFKKLHKLFTGGKRMGARYEVIDIETSGFNKSYDSLLSFAYLTFNEDMTKVLDTGILYFYKEGMKWSMEAEAVHGLTREFLKQYEKDYSENLKKMFKKVARANMVGFNNDYFDNPFISNFLDREMYGPQNFNSSLDLMKVFRPVYGKMKLSVLTYKLGANDSVLNTMSKTWFGEEFGWHKAHGDVVATAFCLLEAKRRNLF